MKDDTQSGRGRSIARRDFVNGVLVASTMGVAPLTSSRAATSGGPYVPALTGMRGSAPGLFEAGHALRDHALGSHHTQDVDELYDLVIVGAGISGLSAAHFYRKYAGSNKKILILDNHDDFGGHARRNEFDVDGTRLVLNGGTLEIESPGRYNRWARTLLDDLGIDLARYRRDCAPVERVYEAHGLTHGVFFDSATWGRDEMVSASLRRGGVHWSFIDADMVARMPLSPRAKADLLRLIDPAQPDYLGALDVAAKKTLLATMSYKDYLLTVARVDPGVYWLFQKALSGVFCVGADALPALFAWMYGYPGFSGLGLGEAPEGLLSDLPGGQHGRQRESGEDVHFPDGNATIARLLIASLVPGVTKANTQEAMAGAHLDYTALDRPGAAVRVRLKSMVVHVAHDGDPAKGGTVALTYSPSGEAHPAQMTRVRGRQVILACWNMVIPYMMPELPEAQKKALSDAVKGPLVYVNVALRNWHAFERLRVSEILCPGSFFDEVALMEPAQIGAVQAPHDPARPIVVRMIKTMGQPGLPKREQYRAARSLLLSLDFATFEREVRGQLQRMLGPGGFDAARDIAAITVNRWPHGYAYTYNSLDDPLDWVFTETDDRPCVRARQPFGCVSIANSDAAASPHTDAAILEAHRAVEEVLERSTFPFVVHR
ncbi:NAD(P)/FAD-dependent oxidoreductase [Ameyamaea chiangmaiensis]|uniref:NAD(P)/FAD-dependent oxidoreductase n=1 Tax=Ameyamaea chiangmaiensis TaxID=442969 RepID=UPI0022329500|nr:NAD(P)/FAD-dependent oxidoreductase [Ameyamaea chiangmaiensis]